MKVPPRLAHLRRDRRGIPVPYVNRWGTTEDVARISLRWDPLWARGWAVFYDDADATEPDFFHQNHGRQRECMAGGYCQVCHRMLQWWDRYLIVSSMSCETVDVNGEQMVVVHEPWLDKRCAEFALEKCPGIIRRRTADDLHLAQVRSPDDVRLIVSRGWVEGPLEEESKRRQPAMLIKAALTNITIEMTGG